MKASEHKNFVEAYSNTAETLCGRILDLIPTQPSIMNFESVWDLFKVEGFECGDLGPSLAQAQGALAKAKAIFRERQS